MLLGVEISSKAPPQVCATGLSLTCATGAASQPSWRVPNTIITTHPLSTWGGKGLSWTWILIGLKGKLSQTHLLGEVRRKPGFR